MKKSYWDIVRPTYIENWPSGLYRLSIPSSGIALNRDKVLALGSNIAEYCITFEVTPSQDITMIEAELEKLIIRYPDGAFVRLGSRSPKDSWLGYKEGFKVTDAKKALRIMLDGSERIVDDLHLALRMRYDPWIWVRQWISWIEENPWSEFRCFMKDRKLVGISQYNYLRGVVYPEIKSHEGIIKWGIEQFFKDFERECHLDDVVFDVFVKIKERGNEKQIEVKLLEINPFFEMTDPCLFYWREGFDGSFRYNN